MSQGGAGRGARGFYGGSAASLRERGVDALAEMMNQEEVGLLGGGTTLARNDQFTVRQTPGAAAASPEEREAPESAAAGLGQGREKIRGVAAGTQYDQKVTRAAQPGYLPCKGLLEAEVVAHAGEQRAVRGERERRERPSVALVAPGKLRREVPRLRRAAPVARDEQLTAAPERLEDEVAGASDGGLERRQGLECAQGGGEGGLEGEHRG